MRRSGIYSSGCSTCFEPAHSCDSLFAPALTSRRPRRTAESENKSKKPADFTNAADGIAAKLKDIDTKQRAKSDVDSGGAYVATCAAIFYVWGCEVHLPSPAKRKVAAANIMAVLGPWLDDSEKSAAAKDDFAGHVRNDRVRFVTWYQWALKNQ